MHLGSSLSLRAFARVGSSLSTSDFVSVGSAMSIRSFVRLGSTLSLAGTTAGALRIGSGYMFYNGGDSSLKVFASEPGSSNTKASIVFKNGANKLHGTWVFDAGQFTDSDRRLKTQVRPLLHDVLRATQSVAHRISGSNEDIHSDDNLAVSRNATVTHI